MNFKNITNCLCCLNKNRLLLNLGTFPLANNFKSKGSFEESYPLQLMICDNCYHCQLKYIVNPEILFKDYKYLSGTSNTGLDFFKKNAININNTFLKPGKVLDIACNDGSQLNFFKELNWETYGVDPAENLYNLNSGHTIYCSFWNESVSKKLPIMDLIIAQNVFAHTKDIDLFLINCKSLLHSGSSLFIQTSQKNMIANGEFDTIYHEHISFFNTKSMGILVSRNGLFLNNVTIADIHGESYIFEINLLPKPGNTNEFKIQEKELYSPEIYNVFATNAYKMVNNLKTEIGFYKIQGYTAIGFGAAAKGQTVLCYGNISLELIIDENPLKIGTFSPKMNIPVISLDSAKNIKFDKLLIVILAWNFADEIIMKIKDLQFSEIVIIKKYFPEIVKV